MTDEIEADVRAAIAAIDRVTGEIAATNRRFERLIQILESWDREFKTADGRLLHQLQVIARVYQTA